MTIVRCADPEDRNAWLTALQGALRNANQIRALGVTSSVAPIAAPINVTRQ